MTLLMTCFYNLDKRLAKVEREEMEKYNYILLNKCLYVSWLFSLYEVHNFGFACFTHDLKKLLTGEEGEDTNATSNVVLK
jgi:hypothetical protein